MLRLQPTLCQRAVILLSGDLESIVAYGPSRTEHVSKSIAGQCCPNGGEASLSTGLDGLVYTEAPGENYLYFSSHILMLKLYSGYHTITAVQVRFYLKERFCLKKDFI